MQTRTRGGALVALGAITMTCIVGCAARADIAVTNDADVAVTVRFGDEVVDEVTADGGLVIHGATECYEGPIVVTYGQGEVIAVEGPLCPGQTLAVDDATVEIVDGVGDGVGTS